MAPSPTADATRFIEERRTSPATNTPGKLVSSGNGSRSRACPAELAPPTTYTSCSETFWGFGEGGAVVHPTPGQVLHAARLQPAIRHPRGDEDCVRTELGAAGQPNEVGCAASLQTACVLNGDDHGACVAGRSNPRHRAGPNVVTSTTCPFATRRTLIPAK